MKHQFDRPEDETIRRSVREILRSKCSGKEKRKRLRNLIKKVPPGAERERAKLVVVQAFYGAMKVMKTEGTPYAVEN
jgi:hypothetical protein